MDLLTLPLLLSRELESVLIRVSGSNLPMNYLFIEGSICRKPFKDISFPICLDLYNEFVCVSSLRSIRFLTIIKNLLCWNLFCHHPPPTKNLLFHQNSSHFKGYYLSNWRQRKVNMPKPLIKIHGTSTNLLNLALLKIQAPHADSSNSKQVGCATLLADKSCASWKSAKEKSWRCILERTQHKRSVVLRCANVHPY